MNINDRRIKKVEKVEVGDIINAGLSYFLVVSYLEKIEGFISSNKFTAVNLKDKSSTLVVCNTGDEVLEHFKQHYSNAHLIKSDKIEIVIR
jgi:hypothetical protein